MNKKAIKILFSDRDLLFLAAAILMVSIFTVTSFVYTGSVRETNVRLEAQLTRLLAESGEIIRLSAEVASKEKKTGTKRSVSVVSTLEQILNGLGLEAMVIKPLGKKTVDGFSEENAELEIKETDLNSAVNLLYQIDTASVPMKLKNASIKTAFEDPGKFILKLTVSRLSK